MDEYKLVDKYLKKQNKKKENNIKNKYLYSLINRTLLSVLLLVIALCLVKTNNQNKELIRKEVYTKNISFAKINKYYEKIFGKISPIDSIEVKNTEPVFNETIAYTNKESYKEGVKLTVTNNYLMPILESGIVVYKGDKDNYGHTIIIQQVNGIDLWYVGVNNTNLKLYDYVEKGSLLGEATSNEIYLYYQKDGNFIDYKEYLG